MSELKDDTFFAKILVDFKGDVIEIDSRPSDALALAVRSGAPIFAEDTVVEMAGITLEDDVDEDLEISFSTLREDVHTIEEIDQYSSEFARPVDYELELVMEGKDLPQVIVDLMELDSAYFAPVEWSPAMPMMNWAASPENVSCWR